jgi:KaiC/GvpD/RAD55 family RecA-like ATPase
VSADQFFNQLAIEMVLLPERRLAFTALGIDPYDWPTLPARRIATAFVDATKTKGQDYARLSVVRELEQLQGCDLPTEDGELKAVYEETLSIEQAKGLGRRLIDDPKNANMLVAHWRKRSSKAVQSFFVHESLSDWFADLGHDIEQNKARVLVSDWHKLSKKIGGFNPGRVSLMAAGTGVGKTLWAINFVIAAAKDFPVLFFNMEMTPKDMISRIVSSGTGNTMEELTTGKIDFARLTRLEERLKSRHPIEMTDGRGLTLDQIVAKTTLAKEENPALALVMVDYDQKIKVFGQHREEWMLLLKAVEQLEEMSKALDVHVMLLAQADDDGNPKASKRSKQPAATVLHLLRNENGTYIEPIKNRFGELGWRLEIKFDGAKALATEFEFAHPGRGRSVL